MKRLIVLALVVAACGGGAGDVSTTSQPAAQGDFFDIEVTGIAYPDSVSIPAGKDVRFINESGVSHTVTFDTMDGAPFELDFELGRDAQVGFPLEPGTYTYFCQIHPSMEGTLEVAG